jgi:Mrp family chromosome partitioning ATPase
MEGRGLNHKRAGFALADGMLDAALSGEAWISPPPVRPAPTLGVQEPVMGSGLEASEQLGLLSDNVSQYRPTFSFVAAEPDFAAPLVHVDDLLEPGIVWNLSRPSDRFTVLDRHCPTAYIEQFQLLRTQLLLLRSQSAAAEPLRSLCVTSAVSGEGKSFTARNLAATLAVSTAKRVLLLETGAWDNALPAEAQGLEWALEHPVAWRKAAVTIAGTGLSVIGGPKPGVTIDIEPLPLLVSELRRHFDWVVVDGPALLSSPAAEWVAASAEAALLVVREGDTPFDRVSEAMARIPSDRLAGVVMNRRAPENRPWLPKLRIRLKKARLF